jgi:hypothetical protein
MCAALIFVAACDGVDAPATDMTNEFTENDASLVIGGEDDNEAGGSIIEGIFEGEFTVTYFGDSFPGSSQVETCDVSVLLEEGKYVCAWNAEQSPKSCEGSYSVSGDKITFSSKSIHNHDFDSNLILHGEYEYTMQGNKLTFAAVKNDVGNYEYSLVKR